MNEEFSVNNSSINLFENNFLDNLFSIKTFEELKQIVEVNPKLLLQKMYDSIENFSGKTKKYKNSYYQLSTNIGEIYIFKDENDNISFIGNNLPDIYMLDSLVHNVLYISGGPQYIPEYYQREDEKNLVPICEINGNKFLFSMKTGEIETDDNGNFISYLGIQDNDTYTGSTTGWNNSIGYNYNVLDPGFLSFDKESFEYIGGGYIREGKYIYIKDEGKNVLKSSNNFYGRTLNIHDNKNKIVKNHIFISYDPETGELIKTEDGNYIDDCGEYFNEINIDFNIVGIGLVINGEYKNITNSGEKNLLIETEYDPKLSLDLKKNTIKVHGDIFSYNPETLEIETDEYGRFILRDEEKGIFETYSYSHFFPKTLDNSKNAGMGLIIDGKCEFFKGKNGKKLDALSGYYCFLEDEYKKIILQFSGNRKNVELSYNPETAEIMVDDEGNECFIYKEVLDEKEKSVNTSIDGNLFRSYNRNYETIRSGFYENGIFKPIVDNGESIHGITEINPEYNNFKIEGVELLFNTSNLEVIKDEYGNYISKNREYFGDIVIIIEN